MTDQPPWVTFDSRADALTIVLSESRASRTIEEPDGRLVDVDDGGHPVAIEVLGVSAGFALDDLAEKYEIADLVRQAEPSLPQQYYRASTVRPPTGNGGGETMAHRFKLQYPDGEHAGVFVTSELRWQPGDEFRMPGNVRHRIRAIVPLPVIEEFVIDAAVEIWEVEKV